MSDLISSLILVYLFFYGLIILASVGLILFLVKRRRAEKLDEDKLDIEKY